MLSSSRNDETKTSWANVIRARFKVRCLEVDFCEGENLPDTDLSALDVVKFICSPRRVVSLQPDPSTWLLDSGFSGVFAIQFGNLVRQDVCFPKDPAIAKHRHYSPARLLEEVIDMFFLREGCLQKIIIQPYLGQDGVDHDWCFAEPMESVETPAGYPNIEFQSSCQCGYGTTSGCESTPSVGHCRLLNRV